MRQAIETKYLCPTNSRGARIKAKAQAGSKTYAYDFALSIEENHRKAAKLYAEEKGWIALYTVGALPGGRYCFVHGEPRSDTKEMMLAAMRLAHRYLSHPDVQEVTSNFALPGSAIVKKLESAIKAGEWKYPC